MKQTITFLLALALGISFITGCGGGSNSPGSSNPPGSQEPNAMVTTIAGIAEKSGSDDGDLATAKFSSPDGIVADKDGNLYVCDTGNNCIRKLTPNGTGGYIVSTIAGKAGEPGNDNGNGSSARFDNPTGITIDNFGNLYVCDWNNRIIRKLTPDGSGGYNVSTIAGDGQSGSADGDGTTASFKSLSGITVDNSGNLYVTDSGNYNIRKLTPKGAGFDVSTIAGEAGIDGMDNGPGVDARFMGPGGIIVDNSNGNLYVVDMYACSIRKLELDGLGYRVTTITGGGSRGHNDGVGTAAQFDWPWGIALDSNKNLFVADFSNAIIRKIKFDGTNYQVTTIAGKAGSSGSVNGPGADARFGQPSGITADKNGNLYITDQFYCNIRKITWE